MKYLIAFILFFAPADFIYSQTTQTDHSKTTLIFVRHAEKADDGTNNPPLSEAGLQRAEKLSEILMNDYNISAIYSTGYNRTQQTAFPLANKLGQTVQIYDFNNIPQFLSSITEQHAGGDMLIVGHSNTTPMLVNQLLKSPKYKQLPEDEYGTYFVVTMYSDGVIVDRKMEY